MTLTEIYDRIEELVLIIKQNPEDQDCIFKSEMELAYLEDLKEVLEKDL